ncbi:hypothetical protein D3C81_1820640 [compost metagenome]
MDMDRPDDARCVSVHQLCRFMRKNRFCHLLTWPGNVSSTLNRLVVAPRMPSMYTPSIDRIWRSSTDLRPEVSPLSIEPMPDSMFLP